MNKNICAPIYDYVKPRFVMMKICNRLFIRKKLNRTVFPFPVWKNFLFLLFVQFLSFSVYAQQIELRNAAFSTEDSVQFAKADYLDTHWKNISTTTNWENQGYNGYNGYAWYRMKFQLSYQLKKASLWQDSLRIYLSKIDDCAEIFLNGVMIRKSGSLPYEKDGYITTWSVEQEIHLSTKNPLLQWDKENTIAIRVYDGGGGGGIFGKVPAISMMDRIDGISIQNTELKNNKIRFILKNVFKESINGSVNLSVKGIQKHYNQKIIINGNSSLWIKPDFFIKSSARLVVLSFVDFATKKQVEKIFYIPYILTPKPGPKPKINAVTAYGARKGRPFLYKIPATGTKPLHFNVKGLPKGLQLDSKNEGILTGVLEEEGTYPIEISVKNAAGTDTKTMQIICGNSIALTPPMGWNSWNCWGLSVTQDKVKASAQAMIDKRLIDYGWNYINIDDGWEDKNRDAEGNIKVNEKFPDMIELGNWLHEKGLKFGIYSSPGPMTCGGFLGSYKHELQDAITYANWGVDFLKYDWCSYSSIHGGTDTSLHSYTKPYKTMQMALQKQNRDIVYSLCQYGMKEVWKWGAGVGGNLWRTTGDIEDSWESLFGIGFSQTKQQEYSKPGGGFNDPDMLVVGKVGWGENLHDSRLTPDEQYTHISLWCLLNAPLLIGCDMSKMDDFTVNLLTNAEVIAVDQNTFSKPASPLLTYSNYQVWVKQMSKTEYAIGIFNTAGYDQDLVVDLKGLLQKKTIGIRDLWRQKTESVPQAIMSNYRANIPGHGVKLLLVRVEE